MINLLLADAYKLWKSTAIRVLIVITAVSAGLVTWFAYQIPGGNLDAGLSGIAFMFSDMNVISILGAVLATIMICGDFDNKMIQHAISGGTGRGAIITGKAAILAIAVIVLLLPYGLIIGTAIGSGIDFSLGTASIGFVNLLTSGAELSMAGIWKLTAVMLIMMLVYAAQISLCLPLALLLRKPVLVIAIYYGFSILTGQLLSISKQYAWLDRLLGLTPYGGTHIFLSLDSGAGDMIKAVVVSLAFFAAMMALTYVMFRKAEIK
ncbi:hypothetical protein J41TS12_13470 [Paenibacillus antibioticophila]|uniref:Uncharacterized protein n=1 Tax=Paenibacillus antibioticophila TaxID=1274374 RepID=A0A919XNV3_9BACL|nr:ABC transporter permease [Paenibacillus antibioticophila]GIO36486.1 hypothetical protein J41TS12_13470 [Paenibacillus antibioticophila]